MLIDQRRDRAAVISIRSLQAVKPAIVEESLGDDVFHPLVVVCSRYEYYSSTLFVIDVLNKRPTSSAPARDDKVGSSR